jgi:NADPH-dependent 2,4-dienoyl-CoA reductase/sulfur reductase-like enzyme/rhodanese-related sulfurtransferase
MRDESRGRPTTEQPDDDGRSAGRDSAPADALAGEERDELLRLAAAAAHQLKSPLSSVQTILATLMGGFMGPLEPRQRWILEKAHERCHHGVKLVQDLMKLRTLEQLEPDRLVPVNLVTIFEAAADGFREAAADKGLEFAGRSTDVEVDDAWLRGDPDLVREVLAVLVDNAIKYTPSGGRVEARIMREGETPAAGQIVLEVVDTGIGIDPEEGQHLFEEFYRSPAAKRLSAEGTGLGLSFARRAARTFGGDVELTPAQTGGVRATASFPAVDPPARSGWPGYVASFSDDSRAPRDEEQISQRIVVVGGVAAGSKLAAKIMRLDSRADVTIVERGKFLAYSGCGLPFYVSGAIREQAALLETPLGARRDSWFFHQLKNVRAFDLTEAIRIDRSQQTVLVRSLIDHTERVLPYDHLVLATGARPRIPDLPGTELDGIYTLHGVEDAEALRTRLRTPQVKDVVIVGGGLLGIQITEAVATRGARVTLVDGRPTLLGIVDPELGLLVRRHLERHGVRVLTGSGVAEFRGDGHVEEVQLADGRSLPCEFVLLATGIEPEVGLAREAGLEIGTTGGVRVDAHLRTSDPQIYAVGDCIEQHHLVTGSPVWVPGAAAASIQGRTAAVNICGGDETYPGTVGTLIAKVFDAAVARTGLTETAARQQGLDPVSVLVPGPDRAHFVPEAKTIVLKLIADQASGRVLGAEAYGLGDVSKRIDVIATALVGGLSLAQLSHLNLGYSPAYSMAIDNVVTAANVLRNKLEGRFRGISPLELREELLSGDPPLLLDVRLNVEFRDARLRGSRHVPLGTLRSRVHELPRDRSIVLVCSIGLRSYEAALILATHGFERVRVLDGGLESWPYTVESLA